MKRVVFFVLMGLIVNLGGCSSLDTLLVPLLPLSDTDPAEMSPPEAQPDVVKVIFQNLSTTDAVDVQFFVSQASLIDIMNELFVDENAVSRTIGVAGTGILEPESSDTFERACSDTLTMGTLGGLFFDNETGDSTGAGSPRWFQELGLGLCRSVVTISYASVGDTFTTNITIERP